MTEINVKGELEKMDDSHRSLREDFESFRTSAGSSTSVALSTVDDSKKHRISEVEDGETKKKKKPFYGCSFKALQPLATSTPEVKFKCPNTLEDVKSPSLRKSLEKHYVSGLVSGGKLIAVQNAYFQHFMLQRKDGYTAKRSVIEELISAGRRDGMWSENYIPAGIKNSFFDYLKEKAKICRKRNCQKRLWPIC